MYCLSQFHRGAIYFVHSYAFRTLAPADCLAVSHLWNKFTAVVGRGLCLGVQFHPEKVNVWVDACLKTFWNGVMLKRRLIPKLQLGLRQSFRGTQPVLVVTRKFSTRRAIGDPLSQASL